MSNIEEYKNKGINICQNCRKLTSGMCNECFNKKEQSNFMQVENTIACGHCFPDRFEKVSEDYGIKCECICHNKDIESILNEFDKIPQPDSLQMHQKFTQQDMVNFCQNTIKPFIKNKLIQFINKRLGRN